MVELDETSCDRLEEAAPKLAEHGLALERFGPSAMLVRSLPHAIARTDPEKLLRDIDDDLALNGEALLLGVARYHFESKWRAIREFCATTPDRRKRFEALLDNLVIEPWESMQSMPHADELELELATTIKQELVEVHLEAQRNLCEFLLEYQEALERRHIAAKGLGEMLHHSIVGLKMSTTTREQIESVAATMLACLLALTDPDGA